MLINSSLISALFIFPEVKHTSKLKNCDIINSAKSSEPVLSDSLSQILSLLWYIENISNNPCQQNLVISLTYPRSVKSLKG